MMTNQLQMKCTLWLPRMTNQYTLHIYPRTILSKSHKVCVFHGKVCQSCIPTEKFHDAFSNYTPHTGYYSHVEARRAGAKGIKKVCVWCGGKRTCIDSKDHPEKCKRCLKDNRKCCFHQRSNQGKKDQGDTQGRYLSKDQWNKEVPLQAPPKKSAGKARSTEKSMPNKSTKKKLTDKLVPKKKSTTAKAKRPAKKQNTQSRKAGESAQSKDDLEDSVALSGLGSSHLNLSGPTRSGRQPPLCTKKKLTDKLVPKKKSTPAKAKRPAKKQNTQRRKAGEYAQSKDDLEDSVALSGLGSFHLNLSGPTRSGRQVIPPPYYKPSENGDPQDKKDSISGQAKAPSGRPAKRDRKSTQSEVPDGKKELANWTFPHSFGLK